MNDMSIHESYEHKHIYIYTYVNPYLSLCLRTYIYTEYVGTYTYTYIHVYSENKHLYIYIIGCLLSIAYCPIAAGAITFGSGPTCSAVWSRGIPNHLQCLHEPRRLEALLEKKGHKK